MQRLNRNVWLVLTVTGGELLEDDLTLEGTFWCFNDFARQ